MPNDTRASTRHRPIAFLEGFARELDEWAAGLNGYDEDALARAATSLAERARAVKRFHERPATKAAASC